MKQKLVLNLDELRKSLNYRDYKTLRVLFKESEIADVAEAFSLLDMPESIALFRLVTRQRRSKLFSYLSLERQEELLEELPDVIVASLLNEMEPDDRTKLLEELPLSLRNKILLKLKPEEREVAWQLLSYPENSVGRLMTPDFPALSPGMLVSEALEYIHWSTTLAVEDLNYLFVTADDGSLLGEVNLASLVVCDPPSLCVSECMKKNYVFLTPEEEESTAVETFRKYDRHFIPVVDQANKLLGIVTADDVFDVAEEEATEDIQQFGGHGALEDSYFNTPFLTMFKKRAGWLALLFLAGFITGETIRNYEELLSRWSFLFFFLPTITSAGGNSGSQSASLIIRGLAIKEMNPGDVWRVLQTELFIGLSLGLVLALIAYSRALTWSYGFEVGLIVAVSVIAVVLFGALLGAMLPFVFQKLRLDPAVVSAPVISTLVDVTGVMILFNLALYVMKYFHPI